jgi:heavy metal sensor kinase
MFSSIKAKIIIFYMAVLFVILSVLVVFLYFSLNKIVFSSIDSSLLSRAKALATLINSDENNETEFNFSDDVMWEYNSPKSETFFQIRRLDGAILEKSESVENLELPFIPRGNQTSFETISFKGKPARVVNFYVPAKKGYAGKGHGFFIQCAENIHKQINLLRTYRIILLLSTFAVMIISASGGFLIARKALTPVKKISEAIDKISESNLSERITAKNIPEELNILASSFNRTFDRLELSFNRQKQFVADASHELKTPLSLILSQSEVTLRKERTVEEYRNVLKVIADTTKIISGIVQKLLSIARLSTNKVELKIENIDLNEIIHESVKLLSPLAAQKGISINISAGKQSVISGDRGVLLELFANIIDNAIKYNIPHGRVDISVEKEEGFITIQIKDTGVGIPEKDLDKIFDRFYRVDKSRSKETGGSGLGLSICKEIVKLHGGRIDIKSQPWSETAVFIYFPHPKKGPLAI